MNVTVSYLIIFIYSYLVFYPRIHKIEPALNTPRGSGSSRKEKATLFLSHSIFIESVQSPPLIFRTKNTFCIGNMSLYELKLVDYNAKASDIN